MTNGFYNLKHMTDEELRIFYKDAVLHGYDAHLEYQPIWTREHYEGSSLQEFIKLCSRATHNVCIDRGMYGDTTDPVGEVGFSILSVTPKDKPNFLYIFMTIENLNKLVEKYNLKLIDW